MWLHFITDCKFCILIGIAMQTENALIIIRLPVSNSILNIYSNYF